ncbi:uncharacterized protein C8R40DRAFT_1016900, partial [Lentinula edodes]|uniref:uncharacterized protein n=1 Tax=Lentinula edodes TaxID=5353 RepID=UPI001E8D2EF9
LRRSSALGGGSHSVTKIALELFHKPFILLTASQKAQVLDRQDSENTWINNHRRLSCRSSSCLGISVFVTETGRVLPCDECHKVSRSSKFLKALRSKAPDTKNLKYIPKKYQNKLLAHQWAASNGLKELVESVVRLAINSSNSIYTRFAQGAIAGKYDDYGVFLGLLHAMVQKQDKDERGVGMQNFQYNPEWD